MPDTTQTHADGHRKDVIPETHELIRQEDIEETLGHLADEDNPVLPQFGPEHIDWLRIALSERSHLCCRQYKTDGSIDEEVTRRLKELDAQIDGVSPLVLKVLHFLCRIRTIIPALVKLKQEMNEAEGDDPTTQMIRKMKYDCSKAEVESAVKGLAELRIRPKILDHLAAGQGGG